MGDPIINTQVDAINSTLGNIKVDLAALRPSIRAIKDAIAETYLTETIENVPIASFSDGADEIPVRELQVAITPIQDLNGQTSPYPAGGGKNLIGLNTSPDAAITYNNISASDHTDDSVKLTSANAAYASMVLRYTLKAGTYTLKYQATSSDSFTPAVSVYKVSGSVLLVNSAPPNTARSFTLDEETAIRIQFFATLGTAAARTVTYSQFQLESGSSATDWSPYSNICPISGHTEAKVYRTGKNLLEWYNPASVTHNGVTFTYNDDGTVTANGTATADAYIELTSYKTYSGLFTYTGNPTGSSASTYRTQYRWRNNGTFGSWGYANGSYQDLAEVSNADAFRIRLMVKSGQTVNNLVFKPMLRLTSDTDDTYEPFVGARYVFDLGQTVYGGTLNVTTGVLTITHKEVDLGSLSWTYNSQYTRFESTGITDAKVVSNSTAINGLCSIYKIVVGLGVANTDMSIGMITTPKLLAHDSRYTDYSAFTTAVTGQKLVYELATPTTVQLTAAEVESLFGQNNVWTDTNGNIVKLTYRKAWEIALAEGE